MASGARTSLALHPAYYIGSWIFFSNATILFNKWLIDNAGFRYPVILTWWHMTFATLATQTLARTTTLLDGRRDVKMTVRLYARAVVPIGLLYSGSMVSSTLVYLYLSVPFIQMLKAAAPIVTLLVGWAWGVEHPTGMTFIQVSLIALGVVMASVGEIHFALPGFIFQIAGIFFESFRVIMIQHLMSSSGLNMDPLVSLYYYAPVCALANFALSYMSGWDKTEWTHASEVGFGMLLLNAAVAFMLNVSSVLLIGKTSGLVLILTGILKNILLVTTAVVIWGTPITPLQITGYAIAIVGLVLYQANWQELKTRLAWYPPMMRKPMLMAASLAIATAVVLLWTRGDGDYGKPISAADTIAEADRLSQNWLTWLRVRDGKWWIGSV
ncbi:TPT-domain-containing protein [Xylariomycetidae sp. FL2044]|nr:TPT-domain-containing protein [Xylariomycetidae sp. FL2044]